MIVSQSYRLFMTPWTVARQALLYMEFSRQSSWSGLPLPSPQKKEERKNSNEGRDEDFGVIKLDIYTMW